MKTIEISKEEIKSLSNYYDVTALHVGGLAKQQHAHPHCPPSLVFIERIDQPYDDYATVYWHHLNELNGTEGQTWATTCHRNKTSIASPGWYATNTNGTQQVKSFYN